MTDTVFDDLSNVIKTRRAAASDESYVASLFEKGLDTILKKVGEETTELVIAGKAGDKEAVIHEAADLWFHSLILLEYWNIEPNLILKELKRRQGQSGLAEKASRA
ncbi:MAG: phosphoribosyl-ATP diphosphatase [Pseudomonadota bacterium]